MTETIEVLRELAARFPIPEGRWHRFVDRMVACRRDFEEAVEALAADEAAQAALERLIDESVFELPDGAPADLRAALARLDGLPVPEGQHPFIAEIVPTLEAMRVTLCALAASPRAAAAFAARERGS